MKWGNLFPKRTVKIDSSHRAPLPCTGQQLTIPDLQFSSKQGNVVYLETVLTGGYSFQRQFIKLPQKLKCRAHQNNPFLISIFRQTNSIGEEQRIEWICCKYSFLFSFRWQMCVWQLVLGGLCWMGCDLISLLQRISKFLCDSKKLWDFYLGCTHLSLSLSLCGK